MTLRPVAPPPPVPTSPLALKTELRRHWKVARTALLDLTAAHALTVDRMLRPGTYTTDDVRRWRETILHARDLLDQVDVELMTIVELIERMDDDGS